MSLEENKALAIAVVQGVATASVDRASFTDEAVWWMLGRGELPIEAFADMNRTLSETLLAGGGRMEVHGVTAQDDRVAIEAECFVPLKDGRTYINQYHFLVRFRDGKVCQVKEYYDTAVARRTFAPPAAGAQ